MELGARLPPFNLRSVLVRFSQFWCGLRGPRDPHWEGLQGVTKATENLSQLLRVVAVHF